MMWRKHAGPQSMNKKALIHVRTQLVMAQGSKMRCVSTHQNSINLLVFSR